MSFMFKKYNKYLLLFNTFFNSILFFYSFILFWQQKDNIWTAKRRVQMAR